MGKIVLILTVLLVVLKSAGLIGLSWIVVLLLPVSVAALTAVVLTASGFSLIAIFAAIAAILASLGA